MSWHPNRDDQKILTRHPSPVSNQVTTTRALMRFTGEQLQHCAAFHEAAHTVLLLKAGVVVKAVWIRAVIEPDAAGDSSIGETETGPSVASLEPLLTALAAGERAEDRWMREAGLWSPVRAWAAERGGFHDRDYVRSLVRQHLKRELTYGVTDQEWSDYSAIQAAADQALDQEWGGVLALAGALLNRHHLEGEEAARIAGGMR